MGYDEEEMSLIKIPSRTVLNRGLSTFRGQMFIAFNLFDSANLYSIVTVTFVTGPVNFDSLVTLLFYPDRLPNFIAIICAVVKI